jgi:hypothetical protein
MIKPYRPPHAAPARPVPARPVPARPVPARPVPARPVPVRPVPAAVPRAVRAYGEWPTFGGWAAGLGLPWPGPSLVTVSAAVALACDCRLRRRWRRLRLRLVAGCGLRDCPMPRDGRSDGELLFGARSNSSSLAIPRRQQPDIRRYFPADGSSTQRDGQHLEHARTCRAWRPRPTVDHRDGSACLATEARRAAPGARRHAPGTGARTHGPGMAARGWRPGCDGQAALSQRRISPVTKSGASWCRKWPTSGIRRHSYGAIT